MTTNVQKQESKKCPRCKIELKRTVRSGNYKCEVCKVVFCGITNQLIGPRQLKG